MILRFSHAVLISITDTLKMLWLNGRYRLIPAFLLFLLLALLLVVVKFISPIAPFVYTLF